VNVRTDFRAMTYRPSPRPTFDRPTLIRYGEVTRHLWGDAGSGLVDDWIYVSSGQIHQLVFGLAPGAAFRHSPEYRTIFAADEVLYVLEGEFACANPETGEVHRANVGEAIAFGRDTWHHGFNVGTAPVRVLEFFAPPPAKGTSGAYARTKPYLDQSRYRREPGAPASTMRVLREVDLTWRLEGPDQGVLTGIFAQTSELTVGRTRVLPGRNGDVERHGGDESLYVLSGTLNILVPEADGQKWFELQPRDGFYLPEGVDHQYFCMGGEPVEFIFGVAPSLTPR
jgi:quercetin dioxygenase-like cupin family protein